VRSPNLADVPVLCRLKARLSNSRVQPEVAHQLRGRCKARDIPDSRKQTDRHDAVHARDRQQPLQLIVMENRLAEKPVDRVEVLAETVKFPQALFDCQPLVHGQRLLGQPYPALAPKEVCGWALRDQVRGQDRVDLVLQSRAMANDLRPPRNLATKRLRAIVGHPHLRQEAAGVQLCQDGGVNLVGFDTSFGDEPHRHRVGNDDLGNVRLERRYDGSRVARGLQNNFIGWS
jgi:hypothetical protein